MNYNLLDEEWIPALYRDGKTKRVGVRKAFEEAGRIRQIAASNPMDRVAILRFLLALLYWCKGSPPDDIDAACSESFPAKWFAKLDANKDCFNLLGDGKRFYQDPAARRSRTSMDLIQEIPTGNNFWHFKHSTDEKDGLCAGCCALGLLRLPLFSVSGLPDLKSGINGTPPLYVVPLSMTLLKTLWRNWKPSQTIGIPAWVQPDVSSTSDREVPLLTGLTLLSRRVWLYKPGESGRCVCCGGAKSALIRKCMFQSAGKQENDFWNDPHVVYSDKTPRRSLKAADLRAAEKFRMDRPWPYLLAKIMETGKFVPEEKPTSILIVGFATGKALNIDVWERCISVPPGPSLQQASTYAIRRWGKEGAQLERDKRIERSKEKRRAEAAIAAIRPHVEDRISAKAGELAVADDDAWVSAAEEYRPMMAMVARSLSPGITIAAVQRRREIGRVIPDMRPKKESAEKSSRKKGGDK